MSTNKFSGNCISLPFSGFSHKIVDFHSSVKHRSDLKAVGFSNSPQLVGELSCGQNNRSTCKEDTHKVSFVKYNIFPNGHILSCWQAVQFCKNIFCMKAFVLGQKLLHLRCDWFSEIRKIWTSDFWVFNAWNVSDNSIKQLYHTIIILKNCLVTYFMYVDASYQILFRRHHLP